MTKCGQHRPGRAIAARQAVRLRAQPGGPGGTTIKFDPRTSEFTYYPAPQVTDQPKIEVTYEGAIWYCPRSAAEPGVGVLYPDMTRITTLGAYYFGVDAPTSRMMLRKGAKQAAQ